MSVLCMWFMLGLLLESTINAFTNDHQQRWRISSSTSNTVLGSGDLFASFRNFFGGEGNGDNKSEDETSNDVAAGSSLIASIPGTHFFGWVKIPLVSLAEAIGSCTYVFLLFSSTFYGCSKINQTRGPQIVSHVLFDGNAKYT